MDQPISTNAALLALTQGYAGHDHASLAAEHVDVDFDVPAKMASPGALPAEMALNMAISKYRHYGSLPPIRKRTTR